MKIILISVGIMREPALKELAEKFCSRIPHYVPFDTIVVPDVAASKNTTSDARKTKEGEAILSKISGGDYVILLDERGKEMTSRELSLFIEKKISAFSNNIIFVIGGPYGFSKAVYDRANLMMSLSKMTFTHEMARVIMVEQIYRAMTIMRGEPYHHD